MMTQLGIVLAVYGLLLMQYLIMLLKHTFLLMQKEVKLHLLLR